MLLDNIKKRSLIESWYKERHAKIEKNDKRQLSLSQIVCLYSSFVGSRMNEISARFIFINCLFLLYFFIERKLRISVYRNSREFLSSDWTLLLKWCVCCRLNINQDNFFLKKSLFLNFYNAIIYIIYTESPVIAVEI